MERSEQESKNGIAMMREAMAKARFDRFVCAVIGGEYTRHPDLVSSSEVIVMKALQLMLAADKRWEEYTKGGQE